MESSDLISSPNDSHVAETFLVCERMAWRLWLLPASGYASRPAAQRMRVPQWAKQTFLGDGQWGTRTGEPTRGDSLGSWPSITTIQTSNEGIRFGFCADH